MALHRGDEDVHCELESAGGVTWPDRHSDKLVYFMARSESCSGFVRQVNSKLS